MKRLKYVGAKPKVSQYGVSFDQSKPDSYTFLSAAAELLETLDFNPSEGKEIYLHKIQEREYDGAALVNLLEKYCENVERIFDEGQAHTEALISEYRASVEANPNLSYDEKRAWLGNIDIMRDYYLQYTTNERAYQCILNVIADKIHANHIETIRVPLGRNYGLVLSHLVQVLQDHKPPYDATMKLEEEHGIGYAVLDMNRSQPLDI
jgi:hypothetical protein